MKDGKEGFDCEGSVFGSWLWILIYVFSRVVQAEEFLLGDGLMSGWIRYLLSGITPTSLPVRAALFGSAACSLLLDKYSISLPCCRFSYRGFPLSQTRITLHSFFSYTPVNFILPVRHLSSDDKFICIDSG